MLNLARLKVKLVLFWVIYIKSCSWNNACRLFYFMLNHWQVGHRYRRNTIYINTWFGQFDTIDGNNARTTNSIDKFAHTNLNFFHMNSDHAHKFIENVIINKTWNSINLSNFTSIFVHPDHKLLHAINWMSNGIPSSKQDPFLTPQHLRGPIPSPI